jgi:hypothetical protein
MADNDFMVCPSQVAGGRTDRCGQYSHPRTCWFDKCSMLDNSKPTPTPSITVGTQVRLTGVVVNPLPESDTVIVCIQGASHGITMNPNIEISKSRLEVIRQPFKRGEVLKAINTALWDTADYLVVVDEDSEENVVVLSLHSPHGQRPKDANATHFERRP